MCRARYALDGRTTGSSPCRRSRRVAPGHTAGCRRAPRAVTRSQPRRGIGSAPVGAGVVRCPRRLRDGAGGVLGPLGKEPWGPRVARGRGEEQSAIACVIGSVPMRSLSRTGIWRAGGEAVACDRLAPGARGSARRPRSLRYSSGPARRPRPVALGTSRGRAAAPLHVGRGRWPPSRAVAAEWPWGHGRGGCAWCQLTNRNNLFIVTTDCDAGVAAARGRARAAPRAVGR